MRKTLLILLFALEAVLLGITVSQVLMEGTNALRALQSMLLLGAFAKTEYDFIQLLNETNPAVSSKKAEE